jgi:hypothetical protein
MGLLRRIRGKPKPEAAENRSEKEDVREVGGPDPAKVTVWIDPVTKRFRSLKERPEGTRF